MSNFKTNVLDKALGEINKHTDITVNYEQFKQGRTIKAVQFNFEHKSKPKKALTKDQNTIDMFCNLTEAQINKYSIILAKDHDVSDLAGTKDYSGFQSWIATVLRDPNSVRDVTAKRIFTALKEKTDFLK